VLYRQELSDLAYMTNLRSSKLYAVSMLFCTLALEENLQKSCSFGVGIHTADVDIWSNESFQGIYLNPGHSLASERLWIQKIHSSVGLTHSLCSSVGFTCPTMQKVAKEKQLTMAGVHCRNI